jgi:formate hydrogenlyase subunit 3/multisubunit Na+/H+ antiporter MnhD subunit
MIWLAAIVFPLLVAPLLALRATSALAARVLVPLAALPALAAALTVDAGATGEIPWLLFGTHFGFGPTGRVMLFLTTVLWTLAGIYAGSYLADDPRRARFFAFFALTMSGNVGLVMAQDIGAFYMFFSLMTFSAYGLVVHNGDEEAYRAGRIYLVAAIFGEVLLLAAVLLTVWEADSLLLADAASVIAASGWRDVIVLLAFVGFGVKAGAALVHFWLPLAHPVAPVPASAVLSGAMIKAGLIGWLHFLPLGQGAYAGWGMVLLVAGYVAAFGAVVIGLTQKEPKTVLAYSSVSQMGVITTALGIGLLGAHLWPLVLPAVALFALNHALAKGALFLGVGVALRASPGRAHMAVVGGLSLAALAIAGAPYTGGAIAKHAAKYASGTLDPVLYGMLPTLMAASSVATTLLLARFVLLVAQQTAHHHHHDDGMRAGMLLPWLLLVTGAVVAVPATLTWFALEIDTEEMDVWTTAGPVLIGIVIAAVAARFLRGWNLAVPPGDLVIVLEWLARRLGAIVRCLRLPDPAAWQLNLVDYIEAIAASETRRDLSRRLELRLVRWENAMVAFIGLVLVLVLILVR